MRVIIYRIELSSKLTFCKGISMSNPLDTHIQDYSGVPIQTPGVIPEETLPDTYGQEDTGVSTIAKSESIAEASAPVMSQPVLVVPIQTQANQEAVLTKVMAGTGAVTAFLLEIQTKMNEITNDILDGWIKNLKEIEETVRQLINSPQYLQQQEIRLKGDAAPGQATSGTVSGVGAASGTASSSVINTLDRLRILEQVPATDETIEASTPSDKEASRKEASADLALPLTATLMIGGSLALGGGIEFTTTASRVGGISSNPVSGALEVINHLQITSPQLMETAVPLVNLMVMAPIYYHAWNDAITNFKEGHRNYTQFAQNFAKDALNMINDPKFVDGLIAKLQGSGLEVKDHTQLAAVAKAIVASIALGLLYSTEVGKVQEGKFHGMTEEEFKGIMLGEIKVPDPNAPNLTEQQKLTALMLQSLQTQLTSLPMSERVKLTEGIMEYLADQHDLDSMLTPSKAFDHFLSSSHFLPDVESQAV